MCEVPFWLLESEQPMNGVRRLARGFCQPLGGASGRRTKNAFNFLGQKNLQDGIDECCFAHPGTARYDQHAVAQGEAQSIMLARRERFSGFTFAPAYCFLKINGRILAWLPGQLSNARGDSVLRFAQFRQKNQFLTLHERFGQLVLVQKASKSFWQYSVRRAEQLASVLEQERFR